MSTKKERSVYMTAYAKKRKAVDPEYRNKCNELSLDWYHRHKVEKLSRYQFRKDAGLCPKCGKQPPAPGLIACTRCLEKARIVSQRGIRAIHEHYGSECVCCGETELAFLTLDHTDNSGAAHRRELKGNYKNQIYKQAKDTGVWPANLQILCFNCNCGRQRNGGVCPHEVARRLAAA